MMSRNKNTLSLKKGEGRLMVLFTMLSKKIKEMTIPDNLLLRMQNPMIFLGIIN
jgi:hypothetical protein